MSLTLGQVRTTATIVGASITVNVVVNGTTIRNSTHTGSFVNCDTFTEKDKNTITVTWTHNSGAQISYTARSHTKGHAVCGHISTLKKQCSGTLNSGNSPQTCNLNYSLLRSGFTGQPPIYLERLSQLQKNSRAVTRNSEFQ